MTPLIIEATGSLAALITTLCWFPQALKTLRTRDTRSISLLAQLGLNAGILLWLAYGWMIGSWPIVFSNATTFCLTCSILVAKLRYG